MNNKPEDLHRFVLPKRVHQEVSPEARLFGNVIMWFGVVFVLGTFGGIWIKLFWMGWVFAP